MTEDKNTAGANSIGAGKARCDSEYVDLREQQFSNMLFRDTPIGIKEWEAIKARREAIRRKAKGEGVSDRRDRTGDVGLTGLAFSGGGIRSAAFNLGALQALHSFSGVDGIDYLSTVSGGGYIGCCLTAALAAPKPKDEEKGHEEKKGEDEKEKATGQFPFISENPKLFDDTAAVRHIRDYTNYLMPRGASDLVGSVGIILRGLLVNMLIVAPFLILAVWLTLLLHPRFEYFCQLSLFPYPLRPAFDCQSDGRLLPARGFWYTPTLFVINVAFLVFWAVWSRARPGLFASSAAGKPVSHGFLISVSKALFFLTLIGAAFDLQMIILHYAAGYAERVKEAQLPGGGSWWPSNWVTNLSVILGPAGAILAYFSKNLTQVAATAARSPTWLAWSKKIAAKAALWIAALAIPFLLWVFYLALTLQALQLDNRELISWPTPLSPLCFYFWAFVLTMGLALLTDPNATSLHRLYRERLSKTFLFDPDVGYLFDPVTKERKKGADLRELQPALGDLDMSLCPYPIVNASLNLEGSRFANRRGRNADFFVFTPEYIGSDATGYVRTERIEKKTAIDLGAAMAISGAAISPNMGTATIKPLVFTLAFLNIRLGFWLRNPRTFRPKEPKIDDWKKNEWRAAMDRMLDLAPFRLIREMFSWIDETSRTIYLTDGGNLENLGLHELLRRRCKLIIVFDAEQDPTMSFPSLLTLERFARIDFGAIIKLPWEAVAEHCQAVSNAFKRAKDDGSPVPRTIGPHCAVGEIQYGGEPKDKGVLLYVKSSLTGDEDDYILDYKRRNPDFPHESTGDQFFREEQFEAYRALGFHIVKGFFTRETPFAVCPNENETKEDARQRVREEIKGYLQSPLKHKPEESRNESRGRLLFGR